MTTEAEDLWARAMQTLRTAKSLTVDDPDSAASRAYYSAFHAVLALFVSEGKSYRKHTAVEAAVHRDLVKTGRSPEEVGIALSKLAKLRSMADYGSPAHVSIDEAKEATSMAEFVIGHIQGLLVPDRLDQMGGKSPESSQPAAE